MPVRIEHDGDLAHAERRRVVPLVVSAFIAAGLSCSGNCPPVTEVPRVLAPRYRLVQSATGQLPPVVLSDDGQRRVRLLGDTLVFTPSGSAALPRGTYVEILVLGVRDGTADEVATRTVSGARAYTLVSSDSLYALSEFPGIPPGAPRTVNFVLRAAGSMAVIAGVGIYTAP
ncbi:hypothetical protein J421_1426 [Gemmatirosa kalamazoonensis]|uniref:Lipoprotein n=1 Tax=Gemmatirosa kalamazoonensis TaxID=861299 RepID=W0RHT1_9BACT|nr:hypothetical protein [Gemmatirosa kalamazoonensis]AHG88963.1 hypothetical protein J421_1426 [Gemmatirosa kalamazoonensis]